MTKLSVETDDLIVLIQETRNTLREVQQIYGRGASHLWAANRSSTAISITYQQATKELSRIVNTLQTTRQVLDDLQRDTDKPSSSGIMGKLRALGESIKNFTEPVVKAAQKVRDVVAGLWDAWTGESGEALLKKMMGQNAAFALASTTSQFLAANVQSIQLKEALKQQYGQLHQIMQSMGQAYQKGGQAAVNSLLSSLRKTDAALHSSCNQFAGYAKLFAEDVSEDIQDRWGKLEEGLEKAASFLETGASYVTSFLQGLVVDTVVSTYEGIRDVVVDTYKTTEQLVLHPIQTFKDDFSKMQCFWDKLTPAPRNIPENYDPITGPFRVMWDEIKNTKFTIEPYKEMFKRMFRPVEDHIDEFKEANPNQKIRVVGHGIGELLLIFAPMKGGSWLKGSNLTAKELNVERKLAAGAEEIVEDVVGKGAAGDLIEKPAAKELLEEFINKQISEAERIKLKKWSYPPSDEKYLKYKEIYNDPRYYNQENGNINWPPNNGYKGEGINMTLEEGTLIDRYGEPSGNFFSPEGIPYDSRALALHSDEANYYVYKVITPLGVEGGEIAPWFGRAGGGTQFVKYHDNGKMYTIQELIDEDYIELVSVKKGGIKP
jgi:hypothetical protein